MLNSVSQLLAVTCRMWSHSVTCHPTLVNTPRLNTSQTGQYSISLPRRDGRLSWPRWLVTYRDGLPARRQSPIQVLTQQCTAGSWTHYLLITSPTPPNVPWIRHWRTIQSLADTAVCKAFQLFFYLHRRQADAAWTLDKWQHFSAWCIFTWRINRAKFWSRSDLKWRSLGICLKTETTRTTWPVIRDELLM